MDSTFEEGYVDFTGRVRYAETDQMGVAYHAHYLVWFEVGRASYCRACGFSYQQLESREETFLPVIAAGCRYLKPLRYDDEFLVRTWLRKIRTRHLIFDYRILSPEHEIIYAEGHTEHVVTDSQGQLKRLPETYYRLLQGGSQNR